MNSWDYKYRIFFDSRVKNQFKSFIDKLDKKEKEVYLKIEKFYTSFYSFGILINLLIEDDSKVYKYLKIAKDNKDKIINLPRRLNKYYKKLIEGNFKDSEIKKELYVLMKTANKVKSDNRYWCFIKDCYPLNYKAIESIFNNKYSFKKYKQEKVTNSISDLFNKYYDYINEDKNINEKYNINRIREFDIEIKEGIYYGEWWDKYLTNSDKDKLILYTKNASLNKEDLFYTIIHETYPGHGHFYNYLRNDRTYFDDGAMLLIEGYATYCEWNSYKSEYIDIIKNNELKFLVDSKYNQVKDKNLLIYSSQFLGFKESYYLGALFIENIVKNKFNNNIKEFLDYLVENTKGELFDLYLD